MTSVHSSPKTKSVVGFRVKLVGPPLTAAGCAPLVGAGEREPRVGHVDRLGEVDRDVLVERYVRGAVGGHRAGDRWSIIRAGGSEAGDVVRRHCIVRVIGVLIRHLRGEDGQGAGFAVGEIGIGSMVKVVGPPVTAVSATVRVPEVGQASWNQLPLTLTGSLNVTVTLSVSKTSIAPPAGDVLATVGAGSIVTPVATTLRSSMASP